MQREIVSMINDDARKFKAYPNLLEWVHSETLIHAGSIGKEASDARFKQKAES
jgi:hypothetical protein